MQFIQIKEVRFTAAIPSDQSLKDELKKAINSLYEQLRNEKVDFTSVNTVYFRLEPSINWISLEQKLFEASSQLHKLALSRFPKAKSFLLFCSDYNHKLTDMNGKLVKKLDEELENIRHEELEKLVDASGALYEGNKYHFFRLPSGQTADYFLRIGNCLARQEALHIFSFWAIPSLQNTNLIICDTWSISTLGMFLARLGERYSGNKYECQYLSRYLDDNIGTANEVEEMLEQADDGSVTPLFLVSVVSSGRSLEIYSTAYAHLFINRIPKALVLYYVGNNLSFSPSSHFDMVVLCNLGSVLEGKGLKGFTEDFAVENGQQIFSIDTETYFPKYFEAREHKFSVIKCAIESKPFFERYAGHQIFSICKNGASNTKLNLRRHHAFHVDILKLVKTKEFSERLKSKLEALPNPPTHVICLTKPADLAMAKVLRDLLQGSCKIDIMRMSTFKKIPGRKDILGVLNNNKNRVLFVDAMFISGQSTAQDFQQGLRQGLTAANTSSYAAAISYLIGLLRPDLSSKISSEVGQMVRKCCPTQQGDILTDSVETILLPNWDDQKCPWCAERELHRLLSKKYISQMSWLERDYIDKRISLLMTCGQDGLKENLFFKRYPDQTFMFGKSSLWFDTAHVQNKGLKHTEADVMLAVASAIQYWRDDYWKLPPAQYLLDQQTCFSVNVYNDTLLRAAIWRSLSKTEVDTFLPEKSRKDLLNQVFDNATHKSNADEFVLGWEAARLLGRFLPRVLGNARFESVDWNYLKWTAIET
ncbi:hypothetical protein N9491_02370 [Planktomarina temperata]|nr:hypothetical protein [Planktomarina temperata]